jgi:hypothetical protein
MQDSMLVVSSNKKNVAKDSVSSNSGELYCQMFADLNISADYGFISQIPSRKIMVSLLEKRKLRFSLSPEPK